MNINRSQIYLTTYFPLGSTPQFFTSFEFIRIMQMEYAHICPHFFFFFFSVWAVLWQKKQNLWSCWPKLDTQGRGIFYATWLPGALRKYFVFHPFSMFSLSLRKSVSSEKPHCEKEISPLGQMSKTGHLPGLFHSLSWTHTQCAHGLRLGVRGRPQTSNPKKQKKTQKAFF